MLSHTEAANWLSFADWQPLGATRVTRTTIALHGGAVPGLALDPDTDTKQTGIFLPVTERLRFGHAYRVQVWIRMAIPEADPVRIVLRITTRDSVVDEREIGQGYAWPKQFTATDGLLDLPPPADGARYDLVIRTGSGIHPVVIGRITAIPTTWVHLEPGDPARIRLRLTGDAPSPIRYRIEDPAGTIVGTGSVESGAVVELAPMDGLYRICGDFGSDDPSPRERFVAIAANRDPQPLIDQALSAAAALRERTDQIPNRGWLGYLRQRVDQARSRTDATGDALLAETFRLATWTHRLAADPDARLRLRGVHEWAYESRIDGSGQPFQLKIPEDHDPTRLASLTVFLHGSDNDHLTDSKHLIPGPGEIIATPLGRAKSSWWIGHGEADVLEATDHLLRHWPIDPDRVHLLGSSMGGMARSASPRDSPTVGPAYESIAAVRSTCRPTTWWACRSTSGTVAMMCSFR